MKNPISLLISLLLSVNLTFCTRDNQFSEPEIIIKKDIDIQIDGNYSDWKNIPSIPILCNEFGDQALATDLTANIKIAWNEKGLLMYFQIKDDISYYDTIHPWNGDAVEIFLSSFKSSPDILQFSIPTDFRYKEEGKVIINDHRKSASLKKSDIEFELKGNEEAGITEFEVLLHTESLGLQLSENVQPGIQVYIDDSDKHKDTERNRLTLFSSNYSGFTSFSHYPLKLSSDTYEFPSVCSRIYIEDGKAVRLAVAGLTDREAIIEVWNKDVKIFSASGSNVEGRKLNLDIEKIDIKRDSLFVFADNECIGFHNMILAPRKYIETQSPRFDQSIRFFKLEDLIEFPEPNSALFIGSSSMRMWHTVHDDFPELNVIHRGFGGSNSADVLYYINDIVLPYAPEKIIYYEGDNDIPSGFSPDSVVRNMEIFIEKVMQNRKDTKFYFISPKPARVRLSYWDKYEKLHELMAQMADKYGNVDFINVSEKMFQNGKLQEDLFLEDHLHMNEKGYRIWTREVRSALGLL